MRLADEPGFPVLQPGQPTRDLLLAQALDACITAERRLPGSSQEIIARQPAWARGELRRLVGLAGSLDAAASNAFMSNEFRAEARSRLMRRIGGDTGQVSRGPTPVAMVQRSSVGLSIASHVAGRRRFAVAARLTAGLVAAVLAVAATLTASASALPGEPLYSLKQAQEELGVRLASDDQQRALALLRQADARLNETTRLLEQGRTLDATATTLRYDQVVQRATMAYVGTIDDTPARAPTSANMEASLSQDQDQLRALLQSAPEPARADLREALVATERGRALVADPRPVERALGRIDRADSAAALPTMAAEDLPTVVPTVVQVVQIDSPPAVPTRRPVLVVPTPTPSVVVADGQDDDAAPMTGVVAQVNGANAGHGSASESGSGNASRGGPPQAQPQTGRTSLVVDRGRGADSDQHPEDAPAAVVAPAPAVAPAAVVADVAEVDGHGGAGDRARVPDRTDVADVSSGRTVSGTTDRTVRSDNIAQPIVAQQPGGTGGNASSGDDHTSGGGSSGGGSGAATGGGRSNGGDDGATSRTVAQPVVASPERGTGGSGAHLVSTAPTTVSVRATVPPATTQTARHVGDSTTSSGDGTQKSSAQPTTSTSSQPAAFHISGDSHTSGDNHYGGSEIGH